MYLITGNRHKFDEMKKIIKNEIKILARPYPEIQTNTLEHVVKYGVEFLSEKIEGDFLIEDSGLFIESLNNFPGVFSSYVFKTIGNEGILKLVEGKKIKNASFVSVIAYYDSNIKSFKGICKGIIAEKTRGDKGFGYDPIFIPNKSINTFAEMEITEKNKYSHRGKSTRMLKRYLEEKNKRY
jgi:XTP/dITP diphosphohydrolase